MFRKYTKKVRTLVTFVNLLWEIGRRQGKARTANGINTKAIADQPDLRKTGGGCLLWLLSEPIGNWLVLSSE